MVGKFDIGGREVCDAREVREGRESFELVRGWERRGPLGVEAPVLWGVSDISSS